MRLKLPTSLAPIPFYKGFSALQVRLTFKIEKSITNSSNTRESSRTCLRIIKSSLSFIKCQSSLIKCQFSPHKRFAFRPITANCQSDDFGLPVRQDGLNCKQSMKLYKRRCLPMDELWAVGGKLLNGEQLEEKY